MNSISNQRSTVFQGNQNCFYVILLSTQLLFITSFLLVLISFLSKNIYLVRIWHFLQLRTY